MPQSYTKIWLHIVFSTKERRRFFEDVNLRAEAHAYIARTCQTLESPALIVGGVADHVHILCRLSKVTSPSELVKEIKRPSSRWIKNKSPEVATFAWQNGYSVFSVSHSAVDDVKRYIQNQEKHHRKIGFEEEFVRLLELHEISYDERYLWR